MNFSGSCRKGVVILGLHVALLQAAVAQIGHGYEFEGNGKEADAAVLAALYTKTNHQGLLAEAVGSSSPQLAEALKNQFRYLFLKDPAAAYQLEKIRVTNSQLKNTIEQLLKAQSDSSASLLSRFDLYQIKGEDGRGNVHFTAYFTPVLDAKKEVDSVFRYPIYSKPADIKGTYPTREEIDGKEALRGKGLEVAWTASVLDNYFLQVQGSGYVSYPDGTLTLLTFDGQNKHPYTSVGKYMVERGHIAEKDISLESIRSWFSAHPDSLQSVLFRNKSYTFLGPSGEKPTGASGLPLTANHSIAVDTRFIPLGAVLLARVPVLDEKGVLLSHEYKILTAQDTGGAINGPGHVDLYTGVGEDALKKASAMHHYGSLWLILAKP